MTMTEQTETFQQKTIRNFRVQARYDELMREGKHGHYETMSRVVREEVERERERCAKIAVGYRNAAEYRAAGHANAEAKRAALDKAEAADEILHRISVVDGELEDRKP